MLYELILRFDISFYRFHDRFLNFWIFMISFLPQIGDEYFYRFRQSPSSTKEEEILKGDQKFDPLSLPIYDLFVSFL